MDAQLQRILNEIDRSGVNISALIEYIKPGAARSMVNDWKKGKSTSYRRYSDKIAEFLKVNPAYLRSETDDPSPIREQSSKITLDALLDQEGIADNETRQSIKSLFELAKKAEQNTEFSDEFLKGESGRK